MPKKSGQKELRKVSDLRLWEKNPRSIKKDDYLLLKKKIEKWGQFKPLVICEDGTVLGGNMRLRAYRDLGIKEAWVSVVDPKTETEKLELSVIDNESSGYYDKDRLSELIYQLEEPLDLEALKITGGSVSLEDVLREFSPEDKEPEIPEPELVECPNCHHKFAV